jgi:hypothetical protein
MSTLIGKIVETWKVSSSLSEEGEKAVEWYFEIQKFF